MSLSSSCVFLVSKLDDSQLLALLRSLYIIARADGQVNDMEMAALKEVAVIFGYSNIDIESLLNLRDEGTTLDAAYKVLGIEATATDDDVKAAYRRMALRYHPDRVATSGGDVTAAAEQKFKEINAARK